MDTQINRALLTGRAVARDGSTYSTTYSGFDVYGNPQTISETGSRSRTKSLTYFNNVANWIIGLVDNETIAGVPGGIARTRNSSNGSLSSESRYGVSTTYTYHPDGAIATKRTDKPATTSFNSYERGISKGESRPEGVMITRDVDDLGNIISQSDGEFAWGYGYDGIGRLTSINFPVGSDATISWGATSRTLTRGVLSETTYFDGFGRKASVTREGVTTTYSYDALGRKTFESLPGSSLGTTISYDVLGRITRMDLPVGARTFSYAAGDVTVINERGYSTRYSYDRYGDPDDAHLIAISAPVTAASISMQRNLIGILQSVTQNGVTRQYGYYPSFFLQSITEPETGTTTFGRDGVGNMTSKSVGGSTITYTHDELNRLKTISGTGTSVTFGYNKRSKVTSVANGAATRTFAYDNNGNLTEDKLTIDGYVLPIVYGYDSIDGLSSITYPLNKGTVTYSPDGLGRPTKALPFLTSVIHRASGNLSSVSYANGVVQNFGENTRQLPDSITAGAIQLGLSYSYDNAGNVQSITNSYFPSENLTLGYDAIDRLTTANGVWGSGTIAYDGAGNISRQDLGAYGIDYTYSSNRLASITGSRVLTFGYDGKGNVISNGQSTFAYDLLSQMTCANCGTAAEVKYEYDGQGRRVSEEKGGRRTYFVQAPNGDLQFEYTPFGKTWVKNVFLHGKRVASESGSDAASTTTALSVSASQIAYGSTVSLTASVSPAATGTVEFRDGATVLGSAALSGGSAGLTVSALSVGTHALSAVYLGDANFQGSTGSGSVVVTVRSSTTALTSNPSSASLGQTVGLSASVAGTGPTGQVVFKEGATQLGTASLSAGLAQLTTAALSAGAHAFAAEYQGDGNHSGSSGTVNVVVAQASPAVQLVSSNPNSTLGQPVTFTVTLSGVGGFTPAGTVTLTASGSPMATLTLSNGRATFTTNTLYRGSHSIVATFNGDSNYVAASAGMTQLVSQNSLTGGFTLPPILLDDPNDD